MPGAPVPAFGAFGKTFGSTSGASLGLGSFGTFGTATTSAAGAASGVTGGASSGGAGLGAPLGAPAFGSATLSRPFGSASGPGAQHLPPRQWSPAVPVYSGGSAGSEL